MMQLIVLLLLVQGAALEIPPPSGFVNDFAGVIDSAAIVRMEATIREVREKTQGEIAIVTLADIGNREASDVALQIGRQWGVGAKGEAGDPARNLGVVVLLVPQAFADEFHVSLTNTGAPPVAAPLALPQVRPAIPRTVLVLIAVVIFLILVSALARGARSDRRYRGGGWWSGGGFGGWGGGRGGGGGGGFSGGFGGFGGGGGFSGGGAGGRF